MQFNILINQKKSMEWGINAQQAILFSFLHQAPAWATPLDVGGLTYYHMSKGKICSELPVLTDKPDTAYRLLRQLEEAGLIDMLSRGPKTYYRITARGATWNKDKDANLGDFSEVDFATSEKNPTYENNPPETLVIPGLVTAHFVDLGKKSEVVAGAGTSEKNPGYLGEISEQPRKKIRPTSEKNPTDHITNNQLTTDQVTRSKKHGADVAAPGLSLADMFVRLWDAWPGDLGEKGSRMAAEKTFHSLKPDHRLFRVMMLALLNQTRSKIACRRAGEFASNFPHVERWLRKRRWLDEVPDPDLIPASSGVKPRSALPLAQTARTGSTLERLTDRSWAEC